MEQIFKKDDRVFCMLCGWGTVTGINIISEYPVEVDFDKQQYYTYTRDGRVNHHSPRTLSFTEYKLEGFSQERPEELPKKGDIAWVRNEFPGNWAIGHFYKKVDDYYYVSDYVGQKEWSKRGLEMTTKNPYANEQ